MIQSVTSHDKSNKTTQSSSFCFYWWWLWSPKFPHNTKPACDCHKRSYSVSADGLSDAGLSEKKWLPSELVCCFLYSFIFFNSSVSFLSMFSLNLHTGLPKTDIQTRIDSFLYNVRCENLSQICLCFKSFHKNVKLTRTGNEKMTILFVWLTLLGWNFVRLVALFWVRKSAWFMQLSNILTELTCWPVVNLVQIGYR